MRTKLYKMLIAYCKGKYSFNNDSHIATIRFSYSGRFTNVYKHSPEYYAWLTFLRASDVDIILDFIMLNFDQLKQHLPSACIWLDLHQMTIDDLIPKDIGSPERNEFAYSIMQDVNARKYKHIGKYKSIATNGH